MVAAQEVLIVGADFDPSHRGFFWLAGQGGHGIQTSAAMGMIVAAPVLGRKLPGVVRDEGVDAAVLDPKRLRTP